MGREIPITNRDDIQGGGGNPGEWGSPISTTISGGILNLTKSGSYIVSPESGSSDDLDKITGLSVGDEVILSPENGKTIVIKNGTYLQIRIDFTMDSQYDNMKLFCVGSNVCKQSGRNGNA